ncbi:MAG: hypothetical protein A2X15_13890 [Bacteroidetes bacterium GWB2_32_14]|nr:MAG: hypothetical protein A2X10_15475 [Bacteroidetes bacterium GWA2_33_15]OFX62770.1 MAG: hypothetical protein A2X15_13890 [Bacteroidetes bacterium GWB2_32_14]OFX67491.1 MAG: hypothetical protein A2X14_08580 [Bacteroidetes bacterium GWD2_33_33]
MDRKLLLIILFSTILISCNKEEDKLEYYGNLEGIVSNEYNQPLAGVTVNLGEFQYETQLYGRYVFKNIPVDNYQISFSKETFITASQLVSITRNETVNLNITLIIGENSLEISDSIYDVSNIAGSNYIHIYSNSSWVINNDCSWISTSEKEGCGSLNIRLNWEENLSSMNRIGTVEVVCGNISKKIIIKQDYALNLVDFQGIIGNHAVGIKDSIILKFNKPIEVNYIKSRGAWEYCIDNIKLTNDKKGVSGVFTCAELGGNYPVVFSVNDEKGVKLESEVEVSFFHSKIDFEGYITDFEIINDNQDILISTFNPNRLYKYSIMENKIINVLNLDDIIAPTKFTINPFNNLIYIIGADPSSTYVYTQSNIPYIYLVDGNLNSIQKSIEIKPIASDNIVYPAIIPYDLCFSKNGVGIVLLKINGSTGRKSRIIDSSNNDTTYWNNSLIEFSEVYANYDKTKLVTRGSGAKIYIFDSGNLEFNEIIPSIGALPQYITVNKKNNSIYLGFGMEQCIIDFAGNAISEVSYIDNGWFGSADFSYRDNEEEFIYYYDINFFQLLDYNSATTLMWTDVLSDLKQLTSTTDGKYLITYKLNSDGSSSLYLFDTDFFYTQINKTCANTAS